MKSQKQFKVIFDARILPGFQIDRVKKDLHALLKTEDQETPDAQKCPKCEYRAAGPSDPLLRFGECPACGIIVQKYLEREAKVGAYQNPEIMKRAEVIEKVFHAFLPHDGLLLKLLFLPSDFNAKTIRDIRRKCEIPKEDRLLGVIQCDAVCLAFGMKELYHWSKKGKGAPPDKIPYEAFPQYEFKTSDGMELQFETCDAESGIKYWQEFDLAGYSTGIPIAVLKAIQDIIADATMIEKLEALEKIQIPPFCRRCGSTEIRGGGTKGFGWGKAILTTAFTANPLAGAFVGGIGAGDKILHCNDCGNSWKK